jgi:hypothetical protein
LASEIHDGGPLSLFDVERRSRCKCVTKSFPFGVTYKAGVMIETSEDDDLTIAEREFLGHRISELRAELQQYERTLGLSINPVTAAPLSRGFASYLRARGNEGLAERWAVAFNRYMAAVKDFVGADIDNDAARDAAEDAEERFERIQVEVGTFLRTLPDDDENGGAR